MYYYLDKYPIDEISAEIERIQKKAWDREIPAGKERIREDWPIEVCLNDFIRPFQHLKRDENYDIFCYIAREFHGSFGSVAAIRSGEPSAAKCDVKLSFPYITLPENAVDPMEVVYCDGTPEGYLEAVLYRKMIFGFPRIYNAHSDNDFILFERPNSLNSGWDMLLNVDNWCPKVKKSSLYLYMYEYEHGFEASDGKSRISLRCYNFSDRLDMKRAMGMSSGYPNKLCGANRFHEGKHCCVFSVTSINIAAEL